MGMETRDWRNICIEETAAAFRAQRQLAERAVAQLGDEDLFRTAGAGDNSVAVLLKHVGGNLRSRWTHPFTTDGEKPDRRRDSEFEASPGDAEAVRSIWESGWAALEGVLDALQPEDLDRTVVIRGEPANMFRALNRSLTHTAQHVGQIVLLSKQWRGDAWRTLSIPRV